MKGIIFTEFIDFVEQSFGIDVIEDAIETAAFEHGGAFTAVGTYPHEELLTLVTELHRTTGAEVPAMVQGFGKFLFPRLAANHPELIGGIKDPITFLESVHGMIHVAVRRLYPEAELPDIEVQRTSDGALLEYRSPRPFPHLAQGLIEGCLEHFDVQADVVLGATDEATGRHNFHVRLH